jgi:hypothetical protein
MMPRRRRWRRISLEEFSAQLTSFRHSAFRLEALDAYHDDGEAAALAEFLATGRADPEWHEEWCTLVAGAIAAGRTMSRVHVVTEPVSGYVRFEIAAYLASAAAGEDVRILPGPGGAGLSLPSRDFWLFDSARVTWMDYDRRGGLKALWLSESAADIAWCCRVRDATMHRAVPVRDYTKRAGLALQAPLSAGGRNG